MGSRWRGLTPIGKAAVVLLITLAFIFVAAVPMLLVRHQGHVAPKACYSTGITSIQKVRGCVSVWCWELLRWCVDGTQALCIHGRYPVRPDSHVQMLQW